MKTPKEFLEKQGYSEFVTPPGQETFSPSFGWSTVIRLLSEYASESPSGETLEAVEFAEWIDTNAVRNGFREWTMGSGKEMKHYTTQQLYNEFLQQTGKPTIDTPLKQDK